MCRLLAFAAPRPTSVADAVGDAPLATFTAMARLHDEGWGTAQRRGGRLAVAKAAASGQHDEGLRAALTEPGASAGLVHLRLASPGMALMTDNTHPFTSPDGALAFAHNGGMRPAALIEPLLDPALRAQLRGTTDSERYFALVRTHTARGLAPQEAAAAAAGQLRSLFPGTSQNAVLLTPDELVVVHASSTARIPHADFDASGLEEHELPASHRTGYFQLWTRRDADGTVVFSSSGLPTAGWTPLAPETVTRVDLATLAVTALPVTPSRAALRPVA